MNYSLHKNIPFTAIYISEVFQNYKESIELYQLVKDFCNLFKSGYV